APHLAAPRLPAPPSQRRSPRSHPPRSSLLLSPELVDAGSLALATVRAFWRMRRGDPHSPTVCAPTSGESVCHATLKIQAAPLPPTPPTGHPRRPHRWTGCAGKARARTVVLPTRS